MNDQKTNMRIFAISDLHVDYEENYAWIKALSFHDYQEDILILAGDISHTPKLIESTFKLLKKIFKDVFFVSGNHDLWVGDDSDKNSIERFFAIKKIATHNGIHMEAKIYSEFSIIPLFAWFDFSFGRPSQKLLDTWQDFYLCKWPGDMEEKEVTDYFLKMNENSLTIQSKKIISFSHFVPRIDLMATYIPEKYRFIYPALGTIKLFDQIKELKSDIHVYGHSHVNVHKRIDGTLFINNAFGYPNETYITSKKLKCIHSISIT